MRMENWFYYENYPHVYLKECKYKPKKIKTAKFKDIELESESESELESNTKLESKFELESDIE